jgi:hypothetical protein
MCRQLPGAVGVLAVIAAVVVDLFARHGIEVDFSRRGFYDAAKPQKPRPPLPRRLADRVRSLW